MTLINKVSIFHQPIGCPKPSDRNLNQEDVRVWIKEKSPSVLQKTSYGAYSGIGVLVIGAVLGFFGLKNDSSSAKWGGGTLSLAGIVAGLIGIFGGVKLEKEIPLYQQHKDKNVDELIALLDDEQSRSVAISLLGKKKDVKAFEPLVKILSNDDQVVRSYAIQALEQINDPRTFDTFVKLVNNDSPDIKADGVFGLGLLQDSRAIEIILPLWNADQVGSSSLKKDILEALVKIDKEKATSFMLELITKNDISDRDYELAITTVYSVPTEKAIVPLIDQLLNGSDEGKRGQAARGLTCLCERGFRDKIFEILDNEPRDKVIEALKLIDPLHSGERFLKAAREHCKS